MTTSKLFFAAVLVALPGFAMGHVSAAATGNGATKVDVVITGGHNTVGEDRGRPVILIAAALKVPDQVFRDTFKGVHPAQTGGGPTDAEARANKKVLMEGLSPYGVTDDRLNEVSNYYRYRRNAGEMWKNTPAKAYAMVANGAVTSVVITDAGSGYSSPPDLSVPGIPNAKLTPTLSYGPEFASNGSIKEIKVGP